MDKWLSHPTALKIISVVIGLILWGVVHFDPTSKPNTVASNTETKIIEAVPVHTFGLKSDEYSITNIEPTVVRYFVKGNKTRLLSASDNSYAASLDLTDLKEGTHTVSVTPKLPSGVELLSLSPNQVTVTIDRLGTRTFEAGVIIQGKAAEGYVLGAPIVTPNNQVTVTLPESKLKQVASVKIFVNVEGADSTVTEKKAEVKVFSTSGDEIKDAVVSPAALQVEVPVDMVTKVVPLVIGYTGSLPEGLSIQSVSTDADKVTVSGSQTLLDKLDQLEAYLDLSTISKSGEVQLELQPPEGISAVDPKTVTVTVYLADAATRTINVPIRLENVPEGFKASVVDLPDNKIPLKLSGSPQSLTSLTENQVTATADLSGLDTGEHALTLKLSLPANVGVAEGKAPTINVVLQAADDLSAQPPEGSLDSGSDKPAEGASDAGGTGKSNNSESGVPEGSGGSNSPSDPGSTGNVSPSNPGGASGGSIPGGSSSDPGNEPGASAQPDGAGNTDSTGNLSPSNAGGDTSDNSNSTKTTE